jgi:thioredoxin
LGVVVFLAKSLSPQIENVVQSFGAPESLVGVIIAAVQANVTHLTKADFLAKVYNYEKNPKEWKYEGDKPAIVDFYATWCGPCKTIAPVLEKLAAEYKGKIVVYKIDTDKEPELSAAFGIRSIPTLLFIPAKGTPQVAQGALPEEALRKTIDEFLLGKK